MAADPRKIWQEQQTEPVRVGLEEIHMQASSFERRVRIRNRMEYAAAAVVVAAFACYAVWLPGLLVKLGSVMVIAGTLIVVWQLHRRVSPRPAGGEDCMAHLRGTLERQRDGLRSVAVWYLGPLVPGMVTFLIGLYQRVPPTARERVIIAAAIFVATFVGVWLLNRWGAARLQKRIDGLGR